MTDNSNEPGKSENKIFTIPNILSFIRLGLIPVIIWLYLGEGNSLWAGYLIVLSGITDILDGFIARRFNMTSDFGKVLDPVADKLTQAAMLFGLSIRFPLMLIPFILLVARDVYMGISGLLVIRKTQVVMSAEWHGKAATSLLYATMIVHIFFPNISSTLSLILIVASTVMIAITFILYIVRNTKALRQEKP